MTNEELIAKIKSEIERRLKDYWKICFHDVKVFNEDSNVRELKELLSFLDTLESENPMNQDEALNEEIKKEMVKLPFFIRGKDQIAFARHFAQWGAKRQKEQMMKEAVEAFVLPLDKEIWCNELDKFPELKEGEKVKLIIIKEN